MASPKKLRTLKVSYCTLNISDASNSGHLKISDGFSFGHFLCPKCKSSKKKFSNTDLLFFNSYNHCRNR